MMVLDTPDARADIQSWRSAGLQTYEPYDFSRMAGMPDGTEVKVGFSVAFVSHSAAPWLGLFACQHFMPEYDEQPQYLEHFNGALKILDVWVVGETAQDDLADFIGTVSGVTGVREGTGRMVFRTRTGVIVLAHPKAFETAFGVSPPHLGDGPHLAGFTVGCRSLGLLAGISLAKTESRSVPPTGKELRYGNWLCGVSYRMGYPAVPCKGAVWVKLRRTRSKHILSGREVGPVRHHPDFFTRLVYRGV